MIRVMRKEREKRGWSCEYVAEKVGLSEEAIRLLETGQRNPSYPVLVKLEDLFQMSHRELFGEESPDMAKTPGGNRAAEQNKLNKN